MSPCGRTDGQTNKQTSEYSATQSMDNVRLSFAIEVVFQEVCTWSQLPWAGRQIKQLSIYNHNNNQIINKYTYINITL